MTTELNDDEKRRIVESDEFKAHVAEVKKIIDNRCRMCGRVQAEDGLDVIVNDYESWKEPGSLMILCRECMPMVKVMRSQDEIRAAAVVIAVDLDFGTEVIVWGDKETAAADPSRVCRLPFVNQPGLVEILGRAVASMKDEAAARNSARIGKVLVHLDRIWLYTHRIDQAGREQVAAKMRELADVIERL